jgi:hypothetical protein
MGKSNRNRKFKDLATCKNNFIKILEPESENAPKLHCFTILQIETNKRIK